MKKIVIKMRSMKKMVGDDLLKLALMLSLLKVSYLSTFSHGRDRALHQCLSIRVMGHGGIIRGGESVGLY